MKKLYVSVMVLFIALNSIYAEKIAVFNMDKAFRSYYKTGRAEKSLKKHKAAFKQQALKLEKQRKIKKDFYEEQVRKARNIAYSAEERDKAREEAEGTVKQLKLFDQKAYQLQKRFEKAMVKSSVEFRDVIVGEIKKEIHKLAKTRKIDFVFDSSGKSLNYMPTVIYHGKSFDLTDEIVKVLNKGHENEMPKEPVKLLNRKNGKK